MKKFKKRSAKMNITHYGVLVRRQFRQIFSNAKLFVSLLLQAPVMLLIALFVYNENTFLPDYVSLFDASTIIFVLVFVSALMGILNSYGEICNERPVLTREVFGGLDVTGYVLAKFTVLALIGLAQCLILSAGALIAIDFPFTHPFAGMLLDEMKTKNMIKNRTVGILTDFTFHPYWEDCTHNDYVVTPDKLLNIQGIRKGFKTEQILPLGIPIKPSFSEKLTKEEAREKLGLNKNLSTFLLMGGSMGYGNIAENVKKIDMVDMERDFQLICVCGNNAEAKAEVDKIAAESRHKILVTGFVNYISTIMDASDCIITKPGGLTTSESLVKGLPMIIINPIPGQEERNTQFLMNTGCAMSATKTCPLDECIYQLLMSDTRIETMKRSISEIAKPNSTRDMCSFLVNLAHTPIVEEQMNV